MLRSSSSSSGRAKASPTINRNVDLLALDERPDVDGIEALGMALDDDGAAAVEGEEAHPVAGAVHERRRGHRAQPAAPRRDAPATNVS